jgi:hypothetical protein
MDSGQNDRASGFCGVNIRREAFRELLSAKIVPAITCRIGEASPRILFALVIKITGADLNASGAKVNADDGARLRALGAREPDEREEM